MTVLAGVIAVLLAAAVFLLWQVLSRLSAVDARAQGLELLQRGIEGLRSEVSGQLSQVNQTVLQGQGALGERLDRSAQVVGDLRHSLGSLGQATEQVLGLGRDMSRELNALQQVFRPPKMRGGVGELLLANLLADMLPSENFALQHGFKSGAKVDAVIRLPEGLLPVDAKFPLENFRRVVEASDEKAAQAARKEFVRDVKKHIEDIAQKYILPDEGTLDLAFMYIPAENVYYEAVLRDEEGEILKDAAEHKVVPVSPNSFHAYLAALVRGFRGLKVAAQAKSILESLDRLQGDLRRFGEEFALVGRHLSNAQRAHGEAEKRLTRFEDKLETLSGLGAGTRPAVEAGAAGSALPPA